MKITSEKTDKLIDKAIELGEYLDRDLYDDIRNQLNWELYSCSYAGSVMNLEMMNEAMQERIAKLDLKKMGATTWAAYEGLFKGMTTRIENEIKENSFVLLELLHHHTMLHELSISMICKLNMHIQEYKTSFMNEEDRLCIIEGLQAMMHDYVVESKFKNKMIYDKVNEIFEYHLKGD